VQKNKGGKEEAKAPIIIVRKKVHGHGHHGGSWKVALADFMTAMMAFFLLMWLLESATPKELMAIAGYFQAPGSKHVVGPGGADASVIDLQAPMEQDPIMDTGTSSPMDSAGIMGDAPDSIAEETEKELEEIPAEAEESSGAENLTPEELLEQLAQIEQKNLEELEEQLMAEINNADSALNQLRDQIRMEFTELGLSIQIVDKARRNMFDEGSARLQVYSEDALFALAPIIDKVPNKIAIIGHTDAKPYGAGAMYSNWELSADRANSARRAMVEGGYPESKILAVQGMASVAPMLPENPLDPSNRRIAITVLKKEVAEAMTKIDPKAGQDLLPARLPPAARDAPSRVMTESEVERAIEATKQPK
jgi:chemotaxis protein MotB